MSASAWIAEINNIEARKRVLRKEIKALTERARRPKQALHEFMTRNGYGQYGGVKLTKVAPGVRRPRKRPADKKADAIALFHDIGIPDPRAFYDQFQRTQKPG
uniref:Uncharacterized protein n=1 Tax=Marseillevirus LCMAC103 TaxID=2506604 RepID=A0A481YVA5_9VIRU|nr:MAG: uncharacterized protein LCMAC103_04360 [Marseillevirus LCMAC103]